MDFDLLGLIFERAYDYDQAWPMGCSISWAAFKCFSSFLEWCFKAKSGSTHVSHYLVNFLFVGRRDERHTLLNHFFELPGKLGLLLASEKKRKKESLSPVLTFLGIELDATFDLSRLPVGKLEDLQRWLCTFWCLNKVTLREFQLLLGHLNFTCKVAMPSRTFCVSLYTDTSKVMAPHHIICITRELKGDMEV